VGEQIRFGMCAIKNVGENTVRGILEARERLGKFNSLFEFCDAIDTRLLNRRVLESLIKAGAMDSFGARRAQLYQLIDRAIERAQKAQRAQSSGQHGLFAGGAVEHKEPEIPLPEIDEWPEHELLANELATLGFYISGHPMAKHAARLKEMGALELATLEGRRNAEEVSVAGIVMALRSRKGDRWAIVSLQDMSGALEVLVFPEAFARLETILKSGVPLLLRGRVNVEDAGTRLALQQAQPLDQLSAAETALMRVRVELGNMDEFTLDQLKELFVRSPGPCQIAFDLIDPDGTVATLRSNQRVRPDERLLAAVRQMCGPDAVEVVS
jgi:DNA polymerase-3 subunit alpha